MLRRGLWTRVKHLFCPRALVYKGIVKARDKEGKEDKGRYWHPRSMDRHCHLPAVHSSTIMRYRQGIVLAQSNITHRKGQHFVVYHGTYPTRNITLSPQSNLTSATLVSKIYSNFSLRTSCPLAGRAPPRPLFAQRGTTGRHSLFICYEFPDDPRAAALSVWSYLLRPVSHQGTIHA